MDTPASYGCPCQCAVNYNIVLERLLASSGGIILLVTAAQGCRYPLPGVVAGKVYNCCCQNIKLQGVECIQVLSVWLDSIHAIYPKMRALFALLIQTGQYVCTKIGRLFDLLAKLDGSSPVSLWDVDGGDSSSKCWVWEGTSLTGKLFFWHSKECPIFLGSQEF